MSFNRNKSEFLSITNKVNYYISSDYYLRDCQVPLVSHVKYLGIIIDKYLNWTEHVKMTTAKANYAMYANVLVMLKALPTLLMFAPYWTTPVLCGHHTISIIYLKLRCSKKSSMLCD